MSAQEELELLLSEDLAQVREREDSTLDRLLAACGNRCVLFGAGSLGRTALRNLRRDGIEPLAFADNNSRLWNTRVEGTPVVSPAEAAALYGADAAFFVTIWTTSHRYVETHAQLTSLGVRQVHSSSSFRWKYSADLLPFFCHDFPHKLYEEAAAVRAAFRLWSDDLSRDHYLRQIRFRALGDFQGMAAPDPEPSYFVDSLYALLPDEVFIDCGAYDGDTVRELLRRHDATRAKILALEPDPKNFGALKEYVAGLPCETAARIELCPYAVSDRAGQVRFSASGDVLSAISDEGILVETVPLDALARDRAPSFIKMDIEGAEVDALEGARNVIATHHPILSICIYHRQSDLWRIPLLIDSIYPGYRHFLRSHEEDGWQTVTYAVPPERVRAGVLSKSAAFS
jgi:FkbM family methyltransferase